MRNRGNKIAVTTLRFKDRNYGCALQAYALHKTFAKLGYSSELINYDIKKERKNSVNNQTSVVSSIFQYSLIDILKKSIKKIVLIPRQILNRYRMHNFIKSRALRHQAFDNFEKNIFHKPPMIIQKKTYQKYFQNMIFLYAEAIRYGTQNGIMNFIVWI